MAAKRFLLTNLWVKIPALEASKRLKGHQMDTGEARHVAAGPPLTSLSHVCGHASLEDSLDWANFGLVYHGLKCMVSPYNINNSI